ncbi:hypothetical protein Bbelb_132350 [Branchiostoma belcheri]|nr:hypothetical protein Bbelb_132350 [Branchiostoma belcheri]
MNTLFEVISFSAGVGPGSMRGPAAICHRPALLSDSVRVNWRRTVKQYITSAASLVSSLIVVGAVRALSRPPHIGFPVSRETAHVLLVRQISRLMHAPEHSTRLLTQVDGASVHPGDPDCQQSTGHICYVTDQMNRIKPMPARLLSPTGAGRDYIPNGHRRNWDRSFTGAFYRNMWDLTKRRRDLIVRTPRGTPPVAGIPPGHISYVTDQMNRIKPMPARLLNPAGASRGYIPDGHRRNWDLSFNGKHWSSVWVSVSSWRVQQFGGFHGDSFGLEACRTQDQRTHLGNTYPVQADWFWSLTLEKQRPVPEFLKEKQGRFPERCSFGFVPIKIVLRVALAVEARSGG